MKARNNPPTTLKGVPRAQPHGPWPRGGHGSSPTRRSCRGAAFCPVFSGAFTVRFVTFSGSGWHDVAIPEVLRTRMYAYTSYGRPASALDARRGDPRGPSNAHVRAYVGGLVPRSAKWGRLVRRFWPVFGTLEYAAGTMDAGWPPNAGEHTGESAAKNGTKRGTRRH